MATMSAAWTSRDAGGQIAAAPFAGRSFARVAFGGQVSVPRRNSAYANTNRTLIPAHLRPTRAYIPPAARASHPIYRTVPGASGDDMAMRVGNGTQALVITGYR